MLIVLDVEVAMWHDPNAVARFHHQVGELRNAAAFAHQQIMAMAVVDENSAAFRSIVEVHIVGCINAYERIHQVMATPNYYPLQVAELATYADHLIDEIECFISESGIYPNPPIVDTTVGDLISQRKISLGM